MSVSNSNREVDDIRKTQGTHYGFIILMIGTLSVLGSLGLARFGYTMVLPSMQKGLGLTNAETGTIATGNFIGYLALALVGGFLASHYGPRRVIVTALFLVGGSLLLTATSRGFITAFFWRLVTGMGSGGSNVPVMGLLSAWFVREKRGRAAGLVVGGSSLGVILTGAFVPIILGHTGPEGWKAAWVALGMAALFIAVLAWIFLRNTPGEMGILPMGSPLEPVPPGEGADKKKGPPLSWGAVYRSSSVWHLAAIYASFGFSYIIYCTFFAKYLQDEIGYSVEKAGKIWQMVGWISIFCGLVWGWFSDRAGRKAALFVVSLLQGAAYMIFALWRENAGFMISAGIFGITAWSIPAIMAAACGDRLGPKLAPAALGFITLFFGIAQAVGPAVAGLLADRAGSFVPAFLCAGAIAWLGALGSLFLKKEPESV